MQAGIEHRNTGDKLVDYGAARKQGIAWGERRRHCTSLVHSVIGCAYAWWPWRNCPQTRHFPWRVYRFPSVLTHINGAAAAFG
jgi:hypothetical protein